MSYPFKEIETVFGARLREMTPSEYEEELEDFKKLKDKYIASSSRKEKEYGGYLSRWFSEEICDSAPFSVKYRWHRLPMSFMQYTFG